MKTKEEKQKKFVTEFDINGEKYGGYIYATTFSEAEDFVRQRKATEFLEFLMILVCWHNLEMVIL